MEFHGKPVAWGQVNRQSLEETMYGDLSQLLYFVGPGGAEVAGQLSYRGKGKRHKQEDILWGAIKKLARELTTELLYLELPTYFSLLSCKKIYALHIIPSY